MNATTADPDHRADARVYLRTEVLDQLLADRGITTVAAAADLLGVDPGTIHRFRGRRIKQPSGELMLRWAETLGVAVEVLWDRSDPPPDGADPPSRPPEQPSRPSLPKTPPPPAGPKVGE